MVVMACPRSISVDLFASVMSVVSHIMVCSGHIIWMVDSLSVGGTRPDREAELTPVPIAMFWILQKVPGAKCCSW